ncbi:hypothetical protein LWI28_007884 [Acer negundo]|uniref:Uncharacterized protein n=1 Tax=Acer negundo TaxID=4023 RepID=A0AAD5NWQ8_ACENE|nr:hypothetical protein LWI28_007884 [Acer negundo]KAK4851821.1 hypothetical protein QYF36_018675 [Acer negundo]
MKIERLSEEGVVLLQPAAYSHDQSENHDDDETDDNSILSRSLISLCSCIVFGCCILPLLVVGVILVIY